jgi:hypothetical protein
MTSFKKHMFFLLLNSAIWLSFAVVGLLNDHYRSWPLDAQIVHCMDLALFIIPFSYVVLRLAGSAQRFRDSLWLAFYETVPYAVYDYFYLSASRGNGAAYLGVYWYLTAFYFLPWLEVPVVGLLMDRHEKTLAAAVAGS